MFDLMISNPLLLILFAFLGGIFACFVIWRVFQCTKNLLLSMILLPAVVCAALLAINGSLGTGIAILGVFGLVRFRSMPGSATDIVSIFYAMVIGLMMSTGYVFSAVCITLLIGLMILAAGAFLKVRTSQYELRILVPEDFSDPTPFQKVLKKYCKSVQFDRVRTTNMGSMYELSYLVEPREHADTLAMLDEIRVLNNNLNVSYALVRYDGSTL